MGEGMSELCRWLHEQLEQLPLVRFPFKLELLPKNGMYFLYEEGEVWGHGGDKPRIVRVGTHRGSGNFRNRIKEHYLLDEARMNFGESRPKPSDRSVFRKNIGRALLNKDEDNYLDIWNISFIERRNKVLWGPKRDIEKEKRIEEAVTRIYVDQQLARESLSNTEDKGKRVMANPTPQRRTNQRKRQGNNHERHQENGGVAKNTLKTRTS